MEHYYFIQKDGVKQGPLKLAELKLMTIYFDELIWRSDDDQWKKASEFEELQDLFIIKPPPTPIEEKKKDFNNNYFTTILPYSLGIYIALSLLIAVISFSIANKSWEDVKNKYIINKEEIGKDNYQIETQKINSVVEQLKAVRAHRDILKKYVKPTREKPNILSYDKNAKYDSITMYEGLEYRIRNLVRDSAYNKSLIFFQQTGNLTAKVEPSYKIPQNIVLNEDAYALGQSFLFRAYYAYFSKIYLTKAEQENSSKLFFNIALSSFISLLIMLLIFLLGYYFIKTQIIK